MKKKAKKNVLSTIEWSLVGPILIIVSCFLIVLLLIFIPYEQTDYNQKTISQSHESSTSSTESKGVNEIEYSPSSKLERLQQFLLPKKENELNCAELLFQLDEEGSYVTEFPQETWEECYHKKICLTGYNYKDCAVTRVYELSFDSCPTIKEWYEVANELKRCNIVKNPSTDFSWCVKCLECDKYDNTEKIKEFLGYKITERTYCLWALSILRNDDNICNYIKNDEVARRYCITG